LKGKTAKEVEDLVEKELKQQQSAPDPTGSYSVHSNGGRQYLHDGRQTQWLPATDGMWSLLRDERTSQAYICDGKVSAWCSQFFQAHLESATFPS
jgi:hypothetical protein